MKHMIASLIILLSLTAGCALSYLPRLLALGLSLILIAVIVVSTWWAWRNPTEAFLTRENGSVRLLLSLAFFVVGVLCGLVLTPYLSYYSRAVLVIPLYIIAAWCLLPNRDLRHNALVYVGKKLGGEGVTMSSKRKKLLEEENNE